MDGVPARPGVYLFKRDDGRVLYVGKARDLRVRIASYRREGGDGRILVRFLDREASQVETIVTRTEQEALLLEDTLIKQHKPPHNVRLKDDKSFLMVRIDLQESFPRLKLVRAHDPRLGKKAGRSRYFGPFASASSVRRTLSDLHRVVPLRDCPDSVMQHRSRPCLKHQIGLCSAPCVDLIEEAAYADLVARAARVLSGDIAELERDLETRMQAASDALDFERAAQWRDRLAALRRTVEGQGVRPRDSVHRDLLGLARRGDTAVVHRLSFREGRLAESRSHHFRSELPDEELLHGVVTALYGGGRRSLPEELVLPCVPAEAELLETTLMRDVKLVVPTAGQRMRALDRKDWQLAVERLYPDAAFADSVQDWAFYSDPDLSAGESAPGRISDGAIERGRRCFPSADALHDGQFVHAFGCAVTDPKAWLMPERISDTEMRRLCETGDAGEISVHGMAKLAWFESPTDSYIFVNGAGRVVANAELTLFQQLCARREMSLHLAFKLISSPAESASRRYFEFLRNEAAFDTDYRLEA